VKEDAGEAVFGQARKRQSERVERKRFDSNRNKEVIVATREHAQLHQRHDGKIITNASWREKPLTQTTEL